ncbi:nitrate reductase [Enterococcus canis]|uniref:Nitrate reductase n=1 Tax=Enterococcus canis TaxID=214095 RepID=A0A1L8RCZ7_9ENTE|nr:arginine deiminase family protein [Enterococcus canis]OJG17604.1 nitrate reductase [Enterococcus canis]
MFVKNSTATLRRVLLTTPEYLEVEPIDVISSYWAEKGIDEAQVAAEHQSLITAYRENGVSVEVFQAGAFPNAVFARDCGFMLPDGVLLGNFREEIRHPEQAAYAEKFRQLEIPIVGKVTKGVVEGGDFFFLDDDTLLLGQAARTDETGVEQVKQLVGNRYKVETVKLPAAYLHLDMCFNLITPQLAVGYREAFTPDFLNLLAERGITLISQDEATIFRHGYNLQSLGDNRVLSLAQNQVMNEALTKAGVEVIPVAISEILKAGGGLHCMTFPLERW